MTALRQALELSTRTTPAGSPPAPQVLSRGGAGRAAGGRGRAVGQVQAGSPHSVRVRSESRGSSHHPWPVLLRPRAAWLLQQLLRLAARTLRSVALSAVPHSSGACVSWGPSGPLPPPLLAVPGCQRQPHAATLSEYASSSCCSAKVRPRGSGARSAWLAAARGCCPPGPSS